MVVKRLPPRLAGGARLVTHAVTLGFCAVMVWLGIVFSIEAWTDPTPVLRLPMTIVYGPVTLGFALMMVRYVQFAVLGREQLETAPP
jgi:TRAP-type transport system small permease protein